MARSDVSEALVILTDVAQSELKLFCSLCLAKLLSVCTFNRPCFKQSSFLVFVAGLTRTATKISGDLLPHPQTPFMKTEPPFPFLCLTALFLLCVPSLAPKLPMRHDPVDDRNDLHVDGRPSREPVTKTSSRKREEGGKKK